MTLCYHRRDEPNGSPKLIKHVKHTQYDLSKALLQRLEKSKHLSNCQTRKKTRCCLTTSAISFDPSYGNIRGDD